MAKNAINNLLTSSNLTTTERNKNVKDNLLKKDPGIQKIIESASQRKYPMSLGPHRPKLSKSLRN